MTAGSVPLAGSVEAIILSCSESDQSLRVKTGIFFKSVDAGCACSGDPAPENENNEYCEVLLDISKHSGEAKLMLLS